jgi:DNA modification methylase
MKWKSIIIWNKNQSPMGGGHFRKKYEPIIYGYFNNLFYGQEYSEDDVWDIKRTVKNDLHPTMKPIELVEKAVLYSSKIKNTVLDLFGGSGSTLIACEKTNRKARLMELDPKYVDVIVQRWQDFTGKKATHEKTNKTFDEMKNGKNNLST